MTLSTRLLPLATVAVAASQLFASPDLPQQSHDAAVNRNLNTFNSIVKAVEMNYVDTIRPKEAFNSAIQAFYPLLTHTRNTTTPIRVQS